MAITFSLGLQEKCLTFEKIVHFLDEEPLKGLDAQKGQGIQVYKCLAATSLVWLETRKDLLCG